MIMGCTLRKYTNVVWQKRSFQFTHFTMRQKTQKVTITLHLNRSRWKHENLFRPNFVQFNGWWDGELFGKQINLIRFDGEKSDRFWWKKKFLLIFATTLKFGSQGQRFTPEYFHTHICIPSHCMYTVQDSYNTYFYAVYFIHSLTLCVSGWICMPLCQYHRVEWSFSTGKTF